MVTKAYRFGFLLVFLFLPTQQMLANCTDVATAADETNGYKISKIKAKNVAPPAFVLSALKVKLVSGSHFKIKLVSALSSDFNKSNDQVLLEVLEDVYGTTEKFDITFRGKTIPVPAKRCLVIPKGTKLYGIVDRAKPSYPFYIGGKARLHIFVEDLILANGYQIKIDFADPITKVTPNKTLIRKCKREKNKNCLRGRRTKLKFSPAIVAVGAGTGIALAKDETTNDIIALGFLQSLASATGVDSLVNPPNAAFNKDMIFDVKTTRESVVWVSLAKPATKKK